MTGPTTRPVLLPWLRLPVGLLGMLALVAAIEAAVGAHRADLAPPWAEDWRFAAWAADRQAPGADVLCFGDSLVKYGVLPRAIEARTGLKAYNLATSGGTMPSAYFLLKRALAAGAQPRAVVVDFAALMLRDGDPLTLRNYPELATLADCAELARTDGDADFLAAAAVAKVVPSYAWRFELRGAIRAGFAGQSASHRAEGTAYRQRWETHRGAQPTPPGRVWHPSEDYLIDGVSPESWAIEPRNDAYLDRFVALAAEHQIPVYWLIPPLCPAAHARRAVRGADAAYDRLVRAKLAKFANLVVLDARPAGYDDSVHIDHIHLDRVGARVLSGDIGAALAARLGSTGAPGEWVVLPPVAGRAAIVAEAESRGATAVR